MTQVEERPRTQSTPRRPRRRRRPVRRFLIVSHRWLSLVLGLLLLVITTSGAMLLYRPEIERALHSSAFDVSDKAPSVDLVQAREIVTDAHPSFKPTGVWYQHGVYSVTDDTTNWNVDPGTGEILGHTPETPTWLQILDNIHECALSCEGEPWTIPLLVKEIPHTGWLGYEGADITGGSLVLGIFGLLLLFLTLSGLWLWFPRPSKWRGSMSVRWKRGRFARDTDLHKVGGMISLPFMLLFAVTGAGFELGFMEKAWYAVTPGGHVEYSDAAGVSKSAQGQDISLTQATESARKLAPGATLSYVGLPFDKKTAPYSFWFSDGFDPYGKTQYPGDLGVMVDRKTGAAEISYGGPEDSAYQVLWDQWSYPAHAGYIVNGWWRMIWLLMGLAPLLLAITGISTWLVRRRTKKQRKASRKVPLPTDLAEELAEDPEMDPALASVLDETDVERSAADQSVPTI